MTLLEIEQRIRKGCMQRLARLRSPLIPDEEGFGNIKCGEENVYCSSCQVQLSLCKEFRDIIENTKAFEIKKDLTGARHRKAIDFKREIVGSSND